MAAPTGEIYILAVRCRLVSGHGTPCPYDTPVVSSNQNKTNLMN